MTWWHVEILYDIRGIHSLVQFSPCLSLSSPRSRFWNKDWSTSSLFVKRFQKTWCREVRWGRESNPIKVSLPSKLPLCGILRSSETQAPQSFVTQKVGERRYLYTNAHQFLLEGCCQGMLILRALRACRVGSSGRRKTKGKDWHLVPVESRAGPY